MLNSILINEHVKSYPLESMRVQQIIDYDIILVHYRIGFDLMRMIIQGTTSIINSYFIRAIKNNLES